MKCIKGLAISKIINQTLSLSISQIARTNFMRVVLEKYFLTIVDGKIYEAPETRPKSDRNF